MNSIYLNADKGNDQMARLGDPSAPAKTLDAAFGLLDDALRAGRQVTIFGRNGDGYTATARRAGNYHFHGGTYDMTLVAGAWTINSGTESALTIRSVSTSTLAVYAGGGYVDLRGTLENASIFNARFSSDSLTIPTTKSLVLSNCINGTLGVTTSAGTIRGVSSTFVAISVTQTTGGTAQFYGCVMEEDFAINGQTVSALNCTHTAHTGTATLTNTGSTTIP